VLFPSISSVRGGPKVLTALVALLLTFGLVACGGDDGDENPTTTGATTTAPDSSGQPERGGEASIEDFGSEATGEERSEIEATFEGYLMALADEDYDAACSYLAASVQQSLAQFVGKGAKGCPAALPAVLAPTAGEIAREQANGEITKIRVEDDNSFVVFRAPGAELYNMTIVNEDGEWNVASVAASILVPDL